jgi:peptide/nickel transport system permease protein
MTAFLIRRLAQAVVIVLGVTIIVFIVIHLLPGGPRALLGPRATPRQVRQFIDENGYNKPFFIQYANFVWRLLHGNLGYSYHYNQSVASLIGEALPKSAVLIGFAYFTALAIGIPLGLIQALRRNKPFDYVATTGAFIGYSMPIFWLGVLLILLFSVQLGIFPSEGPQGATVSAVLSDPIALVLPVATLAIGTIAMFSRYMRSSALENLVQDYVRTARAKGVSEARILRNHLLRNSFLPIITLLGLSLPAVISGAVVVESVFNYPGMGLLFWNGATTHDYPLLLGFTVVVAIAVVLGSLLADLLYAVVDPRVRYS